MKSSEQLEFFVGHSPFSDPGQYGSLYDSLPHNIEQLCEIVRGLLLHVKDGPVFDYIIPPERLSELDNRYVSKILDQIVAMDSRELSKQRLPSKRVIAVCRDFSLLMCSILRHKKIPSRIRFGFADPRRFGFNQYKNSYNDLVTLEYWNREDSRWYCVDARTSNVQFNALNAGFDRHDIPIDVYMPAGYVWEKCRMEQVDPTLFRYGYLKSSGGLWFIRNKVMQELAAMNKVEMLLWDCWGYILDSDAAAPVQNPEELSMMDQVAEALQGRNFDLEQINKLYAHHKLKVPDKFLSMSPSQGITKVTMTS